MEIYSERYSLDVCPEDSIRSWLGFRAGLLIFKQLHSADLPVNIVKVRTIPIDTNLTSRAFYNKPSHTIYEFAVSVDPGYGIDETRQHLIYLPIINTKISLRF